MTCTIYGAMTWLFGLCLVAALVVLARGRLASYRATGAWAAPVGDYRPRTAAERRSRGIALLLFAIGLPALFLLVGIELFGVPLGLLDPSTGCTAGWAVPRGIDPV